MSLTIKPSATLAINGLAQKKIAAGEKVYNLSVGEPMLPPADIIVDAAIAAMRAGKTLYPPVAGIPELRQAACEWMNRTYQTAYTKDQTLITCGGKHGIFMALQALVSAGDEVLIIAPYWVSYPSMVEICNGISRIVNTDSNRFVEDLDKFFIENPNNRVKVLLFNNGTNPTGTLYSREQIAAMLVVAEKHNLVVISDEVYSGLTFDDNEFVSCGSFSEHASNVIVIQSCSKHFAMTGWRVGLVFGDVEIIKILTSLQSQSTTGTSSISQWAALAAFQNADELIPKIKIEIEKRRNVFVETFNQLFSQSITVPASGLYCLIPLAAFGIKETDDIGFCRRTLEEANVALVPGSAFGAPGYIRASFGGREDDIRAALSALEKYLRK